MLAPLRFAPVYQVLVWGGRRMMTWRGDLPEGPVGESWDLADHPKGRSVVSEGPHRGTGLDQLVRSYGQALVGTGFRGSSFPLMVKLIDATARLSVQVHPDDASVRSLGVGTNGKTECWLFLSDGGEVFEGLHPGIDAAAFESARVAGTMEQVLNRFETRAGDFFFLPARTVHALGGGCLVYEVQQNSDVTFRVDDWGRVGLDGAPRPLHVKESMATIDFSPRAHGPVVVPTVAHPGGGTVRRLIRCPYFQVEERQGPLLHGDTDERCAIVTCTEGGGELSTDGGSVTLAPMTTALVPAAAGQWRFRGRSDSSLLVSAPRF